MCFLHISGQELSNHMWLMATMPDSTQHRVRLTQVLFSSNMISLSQICVELETKQKRGGGETIHSPGSNSSFNSLKPFLIPPIHTPLAHGFLGCSPTPVPPDCPILSLSEVIPQPASLLPACSCPACSRPQVLLRTLALPSLCRVSQLSGSCPCSATRSWLGFSRSPLLWGTLQAFWQPLPALPKQPAPLRIGGSSGMA